ncbi:MAG: hypothetical protein ACE5KU_03460 [Nitrososphaerales archaeon]
MPTYECNEHQFVENLRKIIDTNFKVVVKRAIRLHDDAKHNVSRLPDCEFERYTPIMTRAKARANVYAAKPFYDEFHRRLYNQDDKVHSARYSRMITLSIPYFRVEYSFDIWGETYCYSFDALFQPEVRLETRKIQPPGPGRRNRSRPVLIHLLSFKPPHPETLNMELPRSVLLFDVNQKIKP